MFDLTSTSLNERRPRRTRRTPPGYLSVGALAVLTSTPRSTLYLQVRNRELSASLWRGRIVVPETAVAELLAIRPLNPATPAASTGRIADGDAANG